MKYFKTIFNSTDWDLLTQTLSKNDSYNIFLERSKDISRKKN